MADYTKCRSVFITDQTQERHKGIKFNHRVEIDSKCTPQRWGTMMWLGNIVYWYQYTDSTGVKYVHKTKTKHNNTDKISVKDDANAIILHCHMCNWPIQSIEIMHIDLPGNTHPLKDDRNLQWMSHHPTNPTDIPVLSWTMIQLSTLF